MSTSAKRACRIMKALRGHTLVGLSNQELAKALNDSPSNITRSLDTLIAEGIAEKLETGRFALSIQALQIAVAHLEEMDRAKQKREELTQRVFAGSQTN